jgi:AcrR family transcriptional regulator
METAVDTREALLDAAESLFAEHGIPASSLRAITQQAGANLAAVHYHFGSKEGLVHAVFARRLSPMNEERLRLLEACDLDRQDALECVLRAFLAPLVRKMRDRSEGLQSFARLMGRAFSEPSGEVRAIVAGEIEESFRRFVQAFHRLLPHLTEREILWRMHFVGGSMGHTVACGDLLERFSGGQCRATDADEALAYLVVFLAAGLRAPALPVSGAVPPGSAVPAVVLGD